MTDKQTPPDWVLIEAAKRCGWNQRDPIILRHLYLPETPYRALCDMIQKYEQPPVDRKLLCAEEAYRVWSFNNEPLLELPRRAIELWEEGFGRD